ncbi:unnamed protein product [Soboliphyme baturini]|uniref:Endo/exonuclease/phosphatase domain-containing protein n=1 Tax=Soboliphyme baturini TaxID=241478 RepID=A0A183J0L5_9BILA|nr:unnamed protein product [Soboliphyme baturini]
MLVCRLATNNAKFGVVVVYTSNGVMGDQRKDEICESMHAVFASVPHHQLWIVAGDLNSQVGWDHSHWHHVMGLEACQRNGDNPRRKLQAKAFTFVQVSAHNLEGEYTFVEELQCALSKVPNTEAVTIMGNFNQHIGVDAEERNGVIGINGHCDLKNNHMKLLQFCAKNGLPIMNNFFEH